MSIIGLLAGRFLHPVALFIVSLLFSYLYKDLLVTITCLPLLFSFFNFFLWILFRPCFLVFF